MRIGIDARLYNQTGVGRYIKNIILELQNLDKENEYFLFVRTEDSKDISKQIVNSKWSIVNCDIRWHSLKEQTFFPKLLNSYNLDLTHFPM